MATCQTTFLSRILRAGFTMFVLLTCIRVWTGPVAVEKTALAQIPDSGMQRKQQIDEAKKTNQLLSEIKLLLAEGVLNVRVQSADNSTGAASTVHRPDK